MGQSNRGNRANEAYIIIIYSIIESSIIGYSIIRIYYNRILYNRDMGGACTIAT